MFLAVVAAYGLCATPSPQPAANQTPLKTITTITVNPLCSILHRNIGQAIGGLLTNDAIFQQSAAVMRKIRIDAANEPTSFSPTGGAGAASQMDDIILTQMVGRVADNLARIESLLSDPHAFPTQAKTDEQRALLVTKQRLLAVAAEQRRLLNILSSTADSNEATDLASRCNPISGCPKNSHPTRISLPHALAAHIVEEQQLEAQASPAVTAIVELCRKP